MSYPSILILDSGIGGLSIVRDIRAQVPLAHINYIADLEYYPYGQKSEQEVSNRVIELVDKAISLLQPDLSVIACNTASTIVLDQLRALFDIPFIGVVPAIKPAVELTKSGVIGILATQRTVSSQYTNKLILEFASNKTVYLQGSSELVHLAEKKVRGETLDSNTLKDEVNQLVKKSHKMDTIVLACTHFPIIKEELKTNYPNIKNWIDSGEAIGRRVAYLTSKLDFEKSKSPTHQSKNQFFNTGPLSPYSQGNIENYLGVFEFNSTIIK